MFAASVGLVADVTDATIAAAQVLADPILTDIWIQSAFVDVSPICGDSGPATAHRLILSRVQHRAGMTGLSKPMFRVGTAAL